MRLLRTPLVLTMLALALILGVSRAAASERRLKVVGSATLQAQTTRAASGFIQVDGKLLDDAGSPVPRARVQLTLPKSGPIVRCSEDASFAVPARQLELETDPAGRFCAELGQELLRSRVVLSYADPSGLLGSTQLELEAIPAPQALDVRLTAPAEMSLEAEHHTVEITAVPRGDLLEPGSHAAPAEPLIVTLALEAPHQPARPLGELRLFAGERGQLELASRNLGAPGNGVLVARFAGNDLWVAAEARSRVLKTAVVRVDALPFDAPIDRSTSTLELPVTARWSQGDVTTGTIEASSGDWRLGAAPVSAKSSMLLLNLPKELLSEAGNDSRKMTSVPITLQYVPHAPWWRPGDPTRIEVLVGPPSSWNKLPWVLAGAALIAWVALIWRRPASRASARTKTSPELPGRPELTVVDGPAGALTGQVLDAHTGAPLTRAEIDIVVPALPALRTLQTVSAADDGSFSLSADLLQREPDGVTPRIQVRASGYVALERPLPRRGHLVVHLVTYRRAILERLLKWAQRRGSPWQGTAPPTPAHIVQTAEVRQDESIATWARQVELAAFGPENPDEDTHRNLTDAEPG